MLFIAGILAIASLLLAVYEAFSHRTWTAGALMAVGVTCVFILFLPKLEVFKAFGVEAKLQKTVTEAVATLSSLKKLSEIGACRRNRMNSSPALASLSTPQI